MFFFQALMLVNKILNQVPVRLIYQVFSIMQLLRGVSVLCTEDAKEIETDFLVPLTAKEHVVSTSNHH